MSDSNLNDEACPGNSIYSQPKKFSLWEIVNDPVWFTIGLIIFLMAVILFMANKISSQNDLVTEREEEILASGYLYHATFERYPALSLIEDTCADKSAIVLDTEFNRLESPVTGKTFYLYCR